MKMLYHSLAAAISALLYLIVAPAAFVSRVAAEFAPDIFASLDAKLTLALDRIAAYMKAESADAGSAFKAFIERSLTHDNFSAGQFDAGRMPA